MVNIWRDGERHCWKCGKKIKKHTRGDYCKNCKDKFLHPLNEKTEK